MRVRGVEVELPDRSHSQAVQNRLREVFKVHPVRGHAGSLPRKYLKFEVSIRVHAVGSSARKEGRVRGSPPGQGLLAADASCATVSTREAPR